MKSDFGFPQSFDTFIHVNHVYHHFTLDVLAVKFPVLDQFFLPRDVPDVERGVVSDIPLAVEPFRLLQFWNLGSHKAGIQKMGFTRTI